MTESDYLHECGRAELLGLPPPSREEFFSRQRDSAVEGISQHQQGEEEEEREMTAEQSEEAAIRQEGFRRIGGGLDELNSILTNTQKKLNRFKNVCGSFGNLLKVHLGVRKEGRDGSAKEDSVADAGNEHLTEASEVGRGRPNPGGDSQLDKLDSLISKAERAELSLSSQNKQMKKFLN